MASLSNEIPCGGHNLLIIEITFTIIVTCENENCLE